MQPAKQVSCADLFEAKMDLLLSALGKLMVKVKAEAKEGDSGCSCANHSSWESLSCGGLYQHQQHSSSNNKTKGVFQHHPQTPRCILFSLYFHFHAFSCQNIDFQFILIANLDSGDENDLKRPLLKKNRKNRPVL